MDADELRTIAALVDYALEHLSPGVVVTATFGDIVGTAEVTADRVAVVRTARVAGAARWPVEERVSPGV